MKNHKPGIISLPWPAQLSGQQDESLSPVCSPDRWSPLQRDTAFCAHVDVCWNLPLQHLPTKPTNQTESSPSPAGPSTSHPTLGFLSQLRLSQLDSSTEMMDWADFWNQTSSWGERAGNKTLDQAQVRDAEEAFLAWAEGLLRRCGQGE